MTNKVYIIGRDYNVHEVFNEYGWEVMERMEDADYVCLTGGSDISPTLYNQVPHKTTRWIPSRDAHEVEHYNKARALGKKVLGICRGAQLMNALEGGDMYQHVNNHHGHHQLYDKETKEYKTVNSIHHQMMMPSNNSFIVAISKGQSTQRERMVESKDGPIIHAHLGEHEDPEVLIFHDDGTNFGLGFQGHPEYGHRETSDYFFELIRRYL